MATTAKLERFAARIRPEEKRTLERAAKLTGRKLTDFVMGSAHEVALQTIERLSDHLTELADTIVQETLPLCWQTIKKRHREAPKFAVIGYGKMGGKELGYVSDLDLVFLFDDDAQDAPENYTRLGQRLSTWLSSQTPAGRICSGKPGCFWSRFIATMRKSMGALSRRASSIDSSVNESLPPDTQTITTSPSTIMP